MPPSAAALLACAMLVSQVASAGESVAAFVLPSGVSVQIVEAPFVRAKHRVLGCTGAGTPCLIDGGIPYGIDNRLPATYVKQISVQFRGKRYLLDSSRMFDAWGGRPLAVEGVVRYFGGHCADENFCAFRGLFSDGAGSFVAEWHVVGGVSTRTVLSWSDDIMSLFMKSIDPPEIE